MKKLIAIAVLLSAATVMFGAEATSSTNGDVRFFLANGDVLTTTPVGARANGVKLVGPPALNKIYVLRENASVSTGTALWEHKTTTSLTSGYTTVDPVSFTIPTTGLKFNTDDGATTVILYLR